MKIAGILPSLLVSLVHFRLSVLVAPHANVVFQRWFDTGERPSGVDAVIADVNGFLSKPIRLGICSASCLWFGARVVGGHYCQ